MSIQAVILAAGRGKRMGTLTNEIPKPMLELGEKTLIEHKLDILPESVSEIIMVVGYLGEKIVQKFGTNYKGIPIKYVWQKELKGTGHALWQVKEHIKGRFLVMMGDDIYSRADVNECLQHDWSILVKKYENPGTYRGGKVVLDEKNIVREIVEGKHEGENILISAALYVLQPHIFEYDLVQIPGTEEWGLPQTLVKVVSDHNINVVVSRFWLQMTDPTDIENGYRLLAMQNG